MTRGSTIAIILGGGALAYVAYNLSRGFTVTGLVPSTALPNLNGGLPNTPAAMGLPSGPAPGSSSETIPNALLSAFRSVTDAISGAVASSTPQLTSTQLATTDIGLINPSTAADLPPDLFSQPPVVDPSTSPGDGVDASGLLSSTQIGTGDLVANV